MQKNPITLEQITAIAHDSYIDFLNYRITRDDSLDEPFALWTEDQAEESDPDPLFECSTPQEMLAHITSIL